MTKLNIEAIKEGQQHNKEVLEWVNMKWGESVKAFSDRFGGTPGYKPGDVPEMSWLGVGDLSSPRRHDEQMTSFFPFVTKGGDDLVNNCSEFPVYQNLVRQPSLKGKCPVVSSEDGSSLQSWYRKIWNNENLVFNVFDPANFPSTDNDDKHVIVITTSDNEMLIRYADTGTDTLGSMVAYFSQNPSLSAEHKQLLVFRIMHTFLRLCAYRIPVNTMWRFINGVMDEMSPLTSKKHKADYLDWVMLKTDLLLNLPFPIETDDDTWSDRIHRQLLDVGTALASLGRYDEAAPLAMEIAETFPNDLASYMNAGIAFQFIGNEEATFDCYAKHLGRVVAVNGNLDFSLGSEDEQICVAFISSYFSKFEKSMATTKDGRSRNAATVMPPEAMEAFGCLCLFGTAAPTYAQLVVPMLGVDPRKPLSTYLKEQYRRPVSAKRKLIATMRSGSIGEFKKVFIDVVDRNKPVHIAPVDDKSCSDDLAQMFRNDSRKKTQGMKKNDRACRTCQKDESDVEKLLCCPCRQVFYCSKQCQREHWKWHKHFCWHQLKKIDKKAKSA